MSTKAYAATGRWASVSLLVLVGLAGCYRPTVRSEQHLPPAVERLLALMQERLGLMHEVARWKWNADLPSHDPKREAALLDNLERQGTKVGLKASEVRRFFAAQLAAAKQIQETDFERWQTMGQGKFADVQDLPTQLRPRIDALSAELLVAFAAARPLLHDPLIREQLAMRAVLALPGDGITASVRQTALQPLISALP